MNDVTKEDIQLIVSLPKKYKTYTIRYARFGFYVTNEKNKSLTIYKQFIENLRQNEYEFIDKMFEKYNNNVKIPDTPNQHSGSVKNNVRV